MITDSCKRCDMFGIQIKAADQENERTRTNDMKELHQEKAETARKCDKINCMEVNDTTVIAFDLIKTLPTAVLCGSANVKFGTIVWESTIYVRRKCTSMFGMKALHHGDHKRLNLV